MNHAAPRLQKVIAQWTDQLLANGYCVIPDLLPAGIIEELDGDLAGDFEETPFCSGGFWHLVWR